MRRGRQLPSIPDLKSHRDPSGACVVTGGSNSTLYVSSDYGSTYSAVGKSLYWKAVACSSYLQPQPLAV